MEKFLILFVFVAGAYAIGSNPDASCASLCANGSSGPCQLEDPQSHQCYPFGENGVCPTGTIECGERAEAGPCSSYCSMGSTGPCQHVNLGDEMCSELVGGSCPPFMQYCGTRPQRPRENGAPDSPPLGGGLENLNVRATCGSCGTGSEQPCVQANLGDGRCDHRLPNGVCPVGTFDCVWGIFITEGINFTDHKINTEVAGLIQIDGKDKSTKKAKRAKKVAQDLARKDEATAALAIDMADKLKAVAKVAAKMAQREEQEVAKASLELKKSKLSSSEEKPKKSLLHKVVKDVPSDVSGNISLASKAGK